MACWQWNVPVLPVKPWQMTFVSFHTAGGGGRPAGAVEKALRATPLARIVFRAKTLADMIPKATNRFCFRLWDVNSPRSAREFCRNRLRIYSRPSRCLMPPARPPSVATHTAAAAAAAVALAVRSTPPFLVDANITALCTERPPMGLLDTPQQLQGLAQVAVTQGRAVFNASDAVTGPDTTARACESVGRALQSANRRPAPLKYASCAVVGSGGGLRGSGDGADIDAHEAVLRFNSAVLGPEFAHDVGNRTTLWVASHSPWRQHIFGSSPPAEAVLYCFNPWLGKCHADVLSLRPPFPPALMINPALVSLTMRLQNRFARHTAHSIRPSTGLVGVVLALAMCDEVTLFGFGNVSDGRTSSTCNHYWECNTNQTVYFSGRMRNHDWKAQWRALDSLIGAGAIQYHAPEGRQRPPDRYHRVHVRSSAGSAM